MNEQVDDTCLGTRVRNLVTSDAEDGTALKMRLIKIGSYYRR